VFAVTNIFRSLDPTPVSDELMHARANERFPARRERPAPAHERVAAKALLRVYRGATNHWFVRREGGAIEGAFAARLAAVEFARLLGMGAGSYRILFETPDGGIVEERFIPR
jgi:hypothetical protein